MKIMHKRLLVRRDHVGYSRVEREVMAKVNHPFLVGLNFAFQTEDKLYLVMPYMAGGELFMHLARAGALLEDAVKVYAAEMVLALEHLHSLGIIHRDLKPENVLLDADGHVRLTDYGLAKQLRFDSDDSPAASTAAGAATTTDEGGDAKASASASLSRAQPEATKTMCGTNEYMAPEMVAGQMYGKSVDWWSLGALIYEMLAGKPPFRANDEQKLYRKILNDRIVFPKFLTPACHSLLKGLLERNVEKRLGCQQSTMFETKGVSAIKNHPFFKGIDWKALEQKLTRPPIALEVCGDDDTRWIDTEFTDLELNDEWDWDFEASLDAEREAREAADAEKKGKKPKKPLSEDEVQTLLSRNYKGFSFVYPEFEGDLAAAAVTNNSAEEPRASLADELLEGLEAEIQAISTDGTEHKDDASTVTTTTAATACVESATTVAAARPAKSAAGPQQTKPAQRKPKQPTAPAVPEWMQKRMEKANESKPLVEPPRKEQSKPLAEPQKKQKKKKQSQPVEARPTATPPQVATSRQPAPSPPPALPSLSKALGSKPSVPRWGPRVTPAVTEPPSGTSQEDAALSLEPPRPSQGTSTPPTGDRGPMAAKARVAGIRGGWARVASATSGEYDDEPPSPDAPHRTATPPWEKPPSPLPPAEPFAPVPAPVQVFPGLSSSAPGKPAPAIRGAWGAPKADIVAAASAQPPTSKTLNASAPEWFPDVECW
jgi:serine/threonine protein kinase